MRTRTTAGVSIWRAAMAAASIVAFGCKGGPPAPSPVPIDGAAIVRGTERLAWSQAGYVSGLRFRAYVDDTPVLLGAAVCDGAAPEAMCSSPLPPMTDGPHTIALATVLGAGPESERSESILVQKVSGGASSLSSLRDADVRPGAIGLQATVQVAPDLAFGVDVIARGIRAPAQMAAMPDGRLLIAEADGSVRVVRPGEGRRVTRALGAEHTRRMLAVTSIGPPGLAIDPDFARNQLVYLAAIVDDGASRRLRVVRLREVGGTLGDPASLFETTVAGDGPDAAGTRRGRAPITEGPRLAFGPDGLLYVALPAGFMFDREPLASRPHASMLRLRSDGLAPDVTPLTGVRASPLAFTWDPSTSALWFAFAEDGVTTLEPATTLLEPAAADREPGILPRAVSTRAIARLRLPTTFRPPPSKRALVIGNATGLQTHHLTHTLLGARGAARSVRLAMPVVAGSLSDQLGDFVSGPDGTWFALTSNAEQDGDVVVRLRKID